MSIVKTDASGAGRGAAASVTIAALAVALLAVACYYNTLSFGFVNWDDPKLILDNPYIRGLTAENLRHIWTEPIKETYLPLRVTSYALDYHLWGLNATGYHLMNVILHAVVTLLVLFIVRRLSKSLAAGVFAGVLFAVHPVHTEAVAWASARKDVLSTALFLAAYLLYLRSVDGRHRWWLVWASIIAFVLSGLAKAMVVTLPVLVMLTDFVYGRLRGRGALARAAAVWAIYFAAAALITGIAVHFAASAGAIRPYHFGGPGRTAVFMTYVALYYIKTMIFPSLLSARYPYGDTPDFGVADWVVYLSPVVLVVIVAAVVWLVWRAGTGNGHAKDDNRREAAGWVKLAALGAGWFFVGILPVMNLVSINVLVADRYLYLPSVGAIMAGAAVLWFLWGEPGKEHAGRRRAAVALCVVLAGADLARSYTRNEVWRDSGSLWGSVVKEWPDSAQARLYLAAAYGDAPLSDYDKALQEIRTAEALRPDWGEPHLAAGKVLACMGRNEEAAKEFDTARKMGLDGAQSLYETYISDAGVYEAAGRAEDARLALEKAIQIDPARPEAYNNLGRLLAAQGAHESAVKMYEKAVAVDAKFALGYFNLGVEAGQRRDNAAAKVYYRQAIEADPSYSEAMVNLALIDIAEGRATEAAGLLETATKIRGDVSLWHVHLAVAYANMGDEAGVRRELQTAIKLDDTNELAKKMLQRLNAIQEGGR